MSIEPSLEDQRLLEDTLRRSRVGLTRAEIFVVIASAAGFLAAVVALWAISPPYAFAIGPAIICLLVLVVACRVQFDTPLGFTMPTQLAFVPLVFAVPPAIVPIATALAFALALVPDVVKGETRPGRLLFTPANCFFALGPAAVLAVAHTRPEDAGVLLLLAALGAQFLVDAAGSALRDAVTREASVLSQLRESWVYGVDAALSVPALLAAESLHRTPLAALSMVPLIGLLAVFAHERRRRFESMLELSNAYRGTALVLGDVVEADDSYTGQHCKSVVGLALDVADALGLGAEQRRNLEFGALLHDVGKVAIPKEIINKPGSLDPHEWTIIKTHTVEGQKMLDRVGGFMRDVGLIVRSHHERWDGGGYPDGLAGVQIPMEARVIACCDTWNAMRTDRSYRKALSYEVSFEELRASSGTQLDPSIAEVLMRIVADEEARAVAAAHSERSVRHQTVVESRASSRYDFAA
jgi:putative nucleotidyltransferase with HDIG domain